MLRVDYGRLAHLPDTCAGYLKSGVHLIKYANQAYAPSLVFDDIGLYILVPDMMRYFHLSYSQAVSVFYYSLWIIPPLISLIGFFLLDRSWIKRSISAIGLLLLMCVARYVGDLYIAYFSVVTILIPWILYFYKRNKSDYLFWVFVFVVGFTTGVFHYIRFYSGFCCILFLLVLYLSDYYLSWEKKISLVLLLSLGFLLPHTYFKREYSRSLQFCQENNILSENVTGKAHPFWHTVYVGFGFLKTKNKDDISFDDGCGYRKVLSVFPECPVFVQRHEDVLRDEVLNIATKQTVFFLWTIFAKIGVLLLYFLIFGNIGIIFAICFRKKFVIDIAFLCAVAFSSIFPILSIPISEYTLGFVSVVTLWGIISINNGIDEVFKRIWL